MRRLVVIATALAVLIAAASAFAAGGFNTYTDSVKGTPNTAGSHRAPAAIAFTEQYSASGTNGNRTAPLTRIKSRIYGLVVHTKGFPTCSASHIANAHSDTGCPKGALVATGSIKSILGPTNDQSTSAPGQASCDPLLHAWNGGGGKVVFFFVDQSPTVCAGLQTGAVPPFVGTIKNVGKNLIINTPIPSYVSFPINGIEGSLTHETLHWMKVTKKINGETVAYTTSVGCKHGKRPYSHTFTAELNGQSESDTVSGSQKCR